MEKERQKIIIVDDNLVNLTAGKNIMKMFYEVYPLPSAEKLFGLLKHVTPDLILLDIEMPEMDGYTAIKRLKSEASFADIPVIFLTAKDDEDSELEGLNLGAVDYVRKPFSASLLIKRVETHLLLASQKKELLRINSNLTETVFKKSEQVFNLENAVLNIVAELVEFRDSVTGGHVSRTQGYLRFLIDKLIEENIYHDEVSIWDLDFLLPSAQLHDVGKIAIGDVILNKPDKLTLDEFNEMKKHVIFGVEAIENIEKITPEHEFLQYAKIIAGTHHEKWDGTGYPFGLRGRNIPLEGRLMAIADVYDALISKRPYKKPIPPVEAALIIEEGRGKHFDPVLVDIFNMVSDKFAKIVEEYVHEEMCVGSC
jgi:putative two-component system response regulator